VKWLCFLVLKNMVWVWVMVCSYGFGLKILCTVSGFEWVGVNLGLVMC